MFEHYMCLDIEMTGLSIKRDRVISLCAIEMKFSEATGKSISVVVNPDRYIPAKTTRVHGFTNADVQDKPFFAEYAEAIFKFLHNLPIVVHAPVKGPNIDMIFLNKELKLSGFPEIPEERFINQAPMAFELIKSRSFNDVLDHYEIDRSIRSMHGAEIDAILLSKCFPILYEHYCVYTNVRKKTANDFSYASAQIATGNKLAELLEGWKPATPS